jgi:hypothetical protein
MSVPPSRRSQLVRLLETSDRELPVFGGQRWDRAHGFMHDVLAPAVCPTCDGCDEHCADCGGRGEIEVRRDRDPYAENKMVKYGANGTQHDASHAQQREIERLRVETSKHYVSAADEIADANEHPYAWQLARRRMYDRYDYGPLDIALEGLLLADDEAYEVVNALYVEQRLWVEPATEEERKRVRREPWQIDPSPLMQAVAERGLTFLDQLMPGYPNGLLRAPEPDRPPAVTAPVVRGAGKRLFSERDERIRRRVLTDGEATVAVAVSEGISVSQVNRVIAKGEMT